MPRPATTDRSAGSDQTQDNEGVPVTEYAHRDGSLFDTMGVPMMAGRRSTSVIASARLGCGGQRDAREAAVAEPEPAPWSGSRSASSGTPGADHEIVGVAASVRSRRPDAVPDPEVYVSFDQKPTPGMSYVVRAQGDPAALSGQVRGALAQMTPNVAIANLRTFEEVVASATRTSGLVSWLSVLFGVLAAVLAILGIYSVMSYTVAQRERELAIRAAVGASRSALLAMVLQEGLMLSGAGIAAGAVIALAASGVLRSLLYDVSARDPMVFVGSAAGLAAIAMAGYCSPLPAPRASSRSRRCEANNKK